MEESELIKQRHSRRGQRLLFNTYYDKMYQVSLQYLKIKEDAQDALCEAFVRVFNRLDNFEYRGEGSLKSWIKTIVINESLRLIERNRKFMYNDDIDEAEDLGSIELNENLDMQLFSEIVQQLPDGYRVIFLMFAMDGFSHQEIAEKLNISVSTSKSQLFKARKLIIKELQKIEAYEALRDRKKV